MASQRGRRESPAPDGLATAGIAALAVACCAGLPLIIAAAGGIATRLLFGVGAGVVALLVIGGLTIVRQRRREP